MSTAVTPPVEQPSGPGLSQVERLIDTFVAPSKTFADINRSANWLLPWLIMFACSAVFCTAVGAKIGWDHVAATQMRFAPAFAQKQLDSLPPDQKAKAEQAAVGRTKISSYLFQVFWLIWLLIVALVLWLTFSFGLGAEVTYGKSLAILVFACLPGIIKALLAAAVVGFGSMDPDLFMIQNPIGTNAGYFMSFADTPRFLYSVASAVDLFTIWVLVLTAIGFSVVGKVKQGTSMAVIFGWWLLVTVGGAALGAAFA